MRTAREGVSRATPAPAEVPAGPAWPGLIRRRLRCPRRRRPSAAAVTSVGEVPFSIVSRVTTHFCTSRRDGSSNWTSSSVSSMIERSPRAPGLAFQRLVGHRHQRLVSEHELDPVELEEALELLDEGVARLGEDLHELIAAELVDRRHHRQAADELGDQPVLDEILGQAALERLAGVALLLAHDLGAEADALMADATLDHLLEVRERPPADEQHVGGVDREGTPDGGACDHPAAAPRPSFPQGSSAAPAGHPRHSRPA